MRFMMLYRPGRESDAPPTEAERTAVGEVVEEMVRAGVLLETGGLRPSVSGARVRIGGGDFVVTDGPFAEPKELIAGYAIVQVRSKERAIELAKRFLAVVGRGESEIRLMRDAPPYSPYAADTAERDAVMAAAD